MNLTVRAHQQVSQGGSGCQLFCKLALFEFFLHNYALAVSFQKMDPMLDAIIFGA
jgi:hypothetical protein